MPLRLPVILLLLLALAPGLTACRARWRPAGSEVDQSLPPGPDDAHPEPGPSESATYAHRDFPFPLETVWRATVEAIHTTGVPVPKSAHCADGEGLIDVDALRVRLVSHEPEGTCVQVRYREPAGEPGVVRARELLDEIERRVLSLQFSPTGAR